MVWVVVVRCVIFFLLLLFCLSYSSISGLRLLRYLQHGVQYCASWALTLYRIVLPVQSRCVVLRAMSEDPRPAREYNPMVQGLDTESPGAQITMGLLL